MKNYLSHFICFHLRCFRELSGYKTLEKVDLEKKIVETVTDKDYNQFVEAIERLCSLPYSYKIKEFILEYKRPLVSQITTMETTKPKYDESGRAFITTYGNILQHTM